MSDNIPLHHPLFHCGNCKKNVPCYKHPWNDGEAKGPCSEVFGYLCTLEKKAPIFRNVQSVGCECFEPTNKAVKEYRKEKESAK